MFGWGDREVARWLGWIRHGRKNSRAGSAFAYSRSGEAGFDSRGQKKDLGPMSLKPEAGRRRRMLGG